MGAAEFLTGLRVGRALRDSSHWSAADYRPCDVCFACGHARASHLDEPHRKGEPPKSDRGWCTRPEGSCISGGCACLRFIEATEAQVQEAEAQVAQASPLPTFGGGRYVMLPEED